MITHILHPLIIIAAQITLFALIVTLLNLSSKDKP